MIFDPDQVSGSDLRPRPSEPPGVISDPDQVRGVIPDPDQVKCEGRIDKKYGSYGGAWPDQLYKLRGTC